MNKPRLEKSIGWTDLTINPIKGMCKGGCWYCYTKPFYKMGRLQPEIRLECRQFLKLPNAPKKIFLCSTHDLFGSWVSNEWRDTIFDYIRYFDQHIFQILTKFPENIDRPMPDNVWLGVSIANNADFWRWSHINEKIEASIKFVSHEPMLEEMEFYPKGCDWFIMGRLTGFGKKFDPSKTYIKNLINGSRMNRSLIFMKDNLKDIWGPNLIQEFPK